MSNAELHPDLIKAIKELLPTKDIDGKMYIRIDELKMSNDGLTLYYKGQPIISVPVQLNAGRDTIYVLSLDILYGGVTFR